jgi:hypothetical protein
VALCKFEDNQMLYNWFLIVHVPSHNSLC